MSQSDFVSRGQALVAAGQYQEAVKVCRLGLLGRPTTVEGRVVLGQALLALKRFDEVLAEMRVALELDHTSVPAQVLRAEALLRKGDSAPAIEALHKALQAAPGDPRIMQLLGEAEHGPPRPSIAHPSVGFLGSGDTKNYPQHTSGTGDDGPGNYTQPTSLQAPGSARRSSQRAAIDGPTEMTPPPALLAIGDKSGTVELDPEEEGIELPRDPDFDDLAAPPPASGRAAPAGGSRGAVQPSRSATSGKKAALPEPKRGPAAAVAAAAARPAGKPKPPAATQQLDIDDDDLEEIEETPMPEPMRSSMRNPGPGTRVRNAVAMPSGVIGEFAPGSTAPPGAPTRPQAIPDAPAGILPPTPMPLPPAPRASLAAALPTVAAAQPPPPFVQQQAPYPPTPGSLAAQHPTLAISAPDGLSPAQQQTALAVDQLFASSGTDPNQNWGQPGVDPRSLAAAQEPTARPGELDPQILALMSGGQPNEIPPAAPLIAMDHVQLPAHAAMRTGVRRTRSKLRILLWLLVAVGVIGGGVFAGFKIRAIRLDKQIAAARNRATDLAKADTFNGWSAARDSLSGIAQASSTLANRAALARTRALIAFEFGDGIPEAKTAVEQFGGQGGIDTRIAAAYAALVAGDVKAAKAAGEAAVAGSNEDPAAEYVAAHIALLTGDTKVAVAAMKIASDKEPRPLHGVGLGLAHAAAYNWDDAIAAIDRVRSTSADHPGALIARGAILAASGRIFPGSALGNEVKTQLEQIIAESRVSQAQQPRGISPLQSAFAHLALARVELARGDIVAARRAVRGATDLNLDDQRFAEATIATLNALGELQLARTAGEIAIKQYPTSARAHIAYADVLLALGRANDAIDVLSQQADTMAMPDALAVRGNAYLANGDTASAAADFDAAIRKVPTHEPALVGRAWLELATGEVDAALQRMKARMSQKGSPLAVTAAYAAALRRSGDAADRDMAKELLEKVVAGPATPEAVRAQLELARVYRDAGDSIAARAAYEKAAKNGGIEARFEGALLAIEYSKPQQGREVLEALLKEAGERPSPQLVIETARARLLVGEHEAAGELLAIADKMSSVERFKLDRERARLALRKSDFAGAAIAIDRALETCGNDGETFLIAADVASVENKPEVVDKVKRLAAERLKDRPELHIVNGKLLAAAEKLDEAEAEYQQAAAKLEKASNRRRAQADFGLSVTAFNGKNRGLAEKRVDLVLEEDPTIVDAYILATALAKEKGDKKKAYGFAKKATQFNPDYAYAWLVVGQLAHELKDKRQLADAVGRLTQIAPQGDELKELRGLPALR